MVFWGRGRGGFNSSKSEDFNSKLPKFYVLASNRVAKKTKKGCFKKQNPDFHIYIYKIHSEIWLNLLTDENLRNFGYFTKLKEKRKQKNTDG